MKQRNRQSHGRGRPAGAVWLAVLGLLIDALLPASLSTAPVPLIGAGSFYCGVVPGRPSPAKQSPAQPHHCALCLAAANGLPPRQAPALSAPIFLELASAGVAIGGVPPRRIFVASAQPRGPPPAA